MLKQFINNLIVIFAIGCKPIKSYFKFHLISKSELLNF